MFNKITAICVSIFFFQMIACASTLSQASRKIADDPNSDQTQIQERPISFDSNGLKLQGTLTLPANATSNAKVPAVLLIPGSGPTDRDGNQPGIKTDLLKQIARQIAAKGFASLRFDKRATRTYQSSWPTDLQAQNEFWSWDNFVSDARNAYLALQKVPEVNSKAVSILGHSEGGVFALAISHVLKPKTLILMATPARPLANIMQSQIAAMMEKQNLTSNQKSYFNSEYSRVVLAIEKNGQVPVDVPAGLKALFPLSAGKFLQVTLPLSPISFASSYDGPVLVLNGLMDMQVDPNLDATIIYKAFQERGAGNQQIKLFPNLSHNFKLVKSPSDQGFDGAVSDDALNDVCAWLER